MFKKVDKEANRVRRHQRARNKISGTAERPRLSVYRSEKNIYAQVIDDMNEVTLVSASSLEETQLAAFNAAQLGNTFSSIDDASRMVIKAHGLGPDYELPGLPHRTGHGIGLDIHEWPYVIRNEETVIEPGMCFSVEPMICVPDQFGIRHEDHIYMTKQGPKWFTEPMLSIDDPFGK